MLDLRAAYAGASRRDRLHVGGRLRSCPFDALEPRVPQTGDVLDVGSGHGVLALRLAAAAPGRRVTGVDVDRAKIGLARQAAATAGVANVRFEAVEPGWLPDRTWDALCVVDVLYLLGHEAARALLARLAAAVAPGGVLLVKEIARDPRWKYEVARAQEVLATRVVRITEGATVEFLPPDDIAGVLAAGGLAVEHVPLQRGRLHPHHLVVGRAP